MTSRSTRALSFAKILAGLPSRARATWASIFERTAARKVSGATASFRYAGSREKPESALNSSETSAPIAGSHVKRPVSV
jgi:hypothetical protein